MTKGLTKRCSEPLAGRDKLFDYVIAARVAASSSTKAGNFFIDTHNETLSVGAMRISNEDSSPARIHG
jgi:hypothetical protein